MREGWGLLVSQLLLLFNLCIFIKLDLFNIFRCRLTFLCLFVGERGRCGGGGYTGGTGQIVARNRSQLQLQNIRKSDIVFLPIVLPNSKSLLQSQYYIIY